MKEYLITSSILDSFDWYMTAPVSWKQRAADDLKNQLFRIYTALGPAQQRGVDFEKSIYPDLFMSREAFLRKHGELLALEIYDKCVKGEQQKVIKYSCKVDNIPYLFYCKLDIFFPTNIIDIKTTEEFKGPAKYTGRNQHPLYIAASGVENFNYLVAVGHEEIIRMATYDEHKNMLTPEKKKWEVDSVVDVDASLARSDAMLIIEEKIRSFRSFLKQNKELEVAYTTIFSR